MAQIQQELFIAASAEKVYDALTSQTGLASWWTPKAVAIPKTGSVSRFPFGDDYFKEMRIDEIIFPQLVRWTCIAGAEEWVGTSISFNLEPGTKEQLLTAHPEISDQLQQSSAGVGTLLKFQHIGWEGFTPMLSECSYTWGQFLRSLKLYCETGKGTPWPLQHRIT